MAKGLMDFQFFFITCPDPEMCVLTTGCIPVIIHIAAT